MPIKKIGEANMFKSCYYEPVEKSNHLLVKLENLVNFKFVRKICPPKNAATGRPEWEPMVLFKITLLQFFYNLSDRQVMQEVTFHLVMKWFVGLDVHEAPPCYSKLSQFRSHLGEAKLAKLHNEVIKQARRKKLLSRQLTIIDATQVRAKVDHWKTIDAATAADPDARFGPPDKKSGTRQFGYKAHLAMDDESEIITKVATSPANEHDSQYYEELLPKKPQMITADKAYDSWRHRKRTEKRKHRYAVIPKGDRAQSSREKLAWYGADERAAMKLRKRIEHKIAEMKTQHRMTVCRYWGAAKFRFQAIMTVMVTNLKRMVKLLSQRERCAQT